MNTEKLFQKGGNAKITGVLFASFAVFVVAVLIANFVQTDFGRISISNVYYDNYNGKHMRAKLFRPNLATSENPLPGVVFILELFFIMLTLALVMILSTWFYQITGKIFLSAFMNAMIVTWLFASSQVVAPIP